MTVVTGAEQVIRALDNLEAALGQLTFGQQDRTWRPTLSVVAPLPHGRTRYTVSCDALANFYLNQGDNTLERVKRILRANPTEAVELLANEA